VRPRRAAAWRALPLAFVAYVALALILLRLLARGVPRPVETGISWFVVPVAATAYS
jgi:hypothetical protein